MAKDRKRGAQDGERNSFAFRLKKNWAYPCCFVAGMIFVWALRIVIAHYHGTPTGTDLAKKVVSSNSWGVLAEETFMLERPAEASDDHEVPREIVWRFRDVAPSALRELIQSSDLTAPQKALLLDESRWVVSPNAIEVRPPLTVVRDMDSGPRQRLYDLLARSPGNLAQQFPFVFRGSFEEWFAGSDLPKERLREVARMVFKKSGASVFADLPYFQITASSNEVRALVRQLSRVQAVLLDLELDRHSDLAGLKHYWLRPQKSDDREPLLDSLAQVQGGSRLNVASLLPPFPRLLLYSYPQPRPDFPPNADCVWSSMNFFNAQPDNRFVNQQFTQETLQSQYRVVPKADAFGDIIMLGAPEPGGAVRMIHMCVHIANDVVFTKNGGDVYQPWVLMRLADVRALFPGETNVQVTVFRRNGGS